jgi:predicted lipoprotein with Yx(FWY)xxD motif
MFSGYPRASLWVGAAYVALLLAARHYGSPQPGSAAAEGQPVPLATPPGITLQIRDTGIKARVATGADVVYADALGRSLYTYDKDSARTAVCTGQCAAAWPAALAPPGAEAYGDWSQLPRMDGTRQWVLRGAPLYRFGGDLGVGETKGDGAGGGAWHVVVFHPAEGLILPDGISVREIADAGGTGLVDSAGLTIYAFEGNAAHPKPLCGAVDCAPLWIALEAPAIANPLGDFASVARDDGITQWMYRGKPLYRFGGDVKPGDANGVGVDPRFRPNLIRRFFMPANVAIRRTVELGAILATRRGATLYQHDRVTNEELHPFRTDHGSPALGRAFGTTTCDESCTRIWPPLAAPADAMSSGYWDVVTRADGARQWAYRGFALHTFAADEPGDIGGNAIYTLAQIGGSPKSAEIDPNALVGGSASGLGVSAMFWHAVVP